MKIYLLSPLLLFYIIALDILCHITSEALSTVNENNALQHSHNEWLEDPEFSSWFQEGCDFPVIDASLFNTLAELPSWLQGIPIIIKNVSNSWLAMNKWTKANLIELYGDRRIKSGSEASIVNSGGAAEVPNSLKGFLDQTTQYSLQKMNLNHSGNLSSDAFLFDTTILQSIPELINDFNIPIQFQEWDSFEEERERNMWHMLSLGPSRSGLPFHNHGQTWISIVYGTKHWFVYPIGFASPLELYADPNLAKDYMIVEQWLLNVLPRLKHLPKPPLNGSSDFVTDPYYANHSFGFQPLQCSQHAGDTLYLPSLWSHLTINQGETIAIGGQQALYDDERLQKSKRALQQNLGTFEVYKDIALAMFNKATVELEDLRETFSFSHSSVITLHSVDDLHRLIQKSWNTIVVLNQTHCPRNIEQLQQFALRLKESLNDRIEIDIAMIDGPSCDDTSGSINNNENIEIMYFPGLSDTELQEFDGSTTLPPRSYQFNGVKIPSISLDEAVSTILALFHQHNGAFGSINTVSLYTKMQYKTSLYYCWQAYGIRPFHPETITMVMELAGLSDDFETMLEIANKSFELYTPLSNHLTNTSIASIFYNVGRTIMARGLYQEALPFLRRSLESMSSFRPALKKIIKLCAHLELKAEVFEYFSILKGLSDLDDISEYEQIVNRFI